MGICKRVVFVALLAVFLPTSSIAASVTPSVSQPPVEWLVWLTLISVLPFCLVAMTSFTRIVIVLSMLRHALGLQDTPPNMVLISLSLFLTLFTMQPVLQEIKSASIDPYLSKTMSIEQALPLGVQPLKAYMLKQVSPKDIEFMYSISGIFSRKEVPLSVLVPAFLINELRMAFQIAFIVFLPFLLVDLIVSSILMALGMMMVPPTTISLPLKVLLFILIDGWQLVIQGLVSSFH